MLQANANSVIILRKDVNVSYFFMIVKNLKKNDLNILHIRKHIYVLGGQFAIK